MSTTATSRPAGVIVIAFLYIIMGIIMLIIGPPLAFAGTIIPHLLQSIPEQQQQNSTSGDVDRSQVSPSLLGAGILALGWILMAIGILSFVLAYGLLKGRSAEWNLALIVSTISIAVNGILVATGIMSSIINIIIGGIILNYLYRPCEGIFWQNMSPIMSADQYNIIQCVKSHEGSSSVSLGPAALT